MSFIQSFGHAMIEAFLDGEDLHYLRDKDGDFIIEFGYDDEISGHPRFRLIATGEEDEQYCLRGDTLKRVAKADWARATKLCNEWNCLYKMPKVYLEVDDPNVSSTGRIVCEQWLNLEHGIHQEALNGITSTFFSSCFGFWRWLERQNQLESLTDVETGTDGVGEEHREKGDIVEDES